MSPESESTMPPVVKSTFVLGPSLDGVIEPIPATVPDAKVAAPGRRQVIFDAPPTSPGGNVHLLLEPPLNPGDVLPLNVYAFFCPPSSNVPPPAERTPAWFFEKSGAPNGSIHVASADEDGKFTITVPGVKPSLEPYFVQTILEFPAGS